MSVGAAAMWTLLLLSSLLLIPGTLLAAPEQESNPFGPPLSAPLGQRAILGVAVNTSLLADAQYMGFIRHHFRSVTAENAMKPAVIHPSPERFEFAEADRFVEDARKHGLEVIGHTLVWHSQGANHLFQDEKGQPLSREEALKRMRNYIHKVVGRYKGKVKGWDVVNEAISDSGGMRQTPALRAIGEDYVIKAFEYAAEADPDAELYYNDYNIDLDYKRDSALKLVKEIRDAGARIDAVGIQGHYLLSTSVEEVRRGIAAFTKEGFEIVITELDVDVLPRSGNAGADLSAAEREGLNPFVEGLPKAQQEELAKKYLELFRIFMEEPKVRRITFWGATDGHSWLNNFPVRGRTNHAMLFDREYRPKPAFDAVYGYLQSLPPLRRDPLWTSSGELIPVPVDPQRPVVSIKDPSVVFHDGMWHVFATVARPKDGWQMVYLNFKNWDEAKDAKPRFMDAENPKLTGYHCAPQVFWFEPHKLWYLIFQSQQPQYSTTKDLSDPSSWSEPKDFFPKKPASAPELWIDYWVICDETHAYLFFTGDDGKLYRSRTKLSDFPNGMDEPVVILEEKDRFFLFEASCHYRLKDTGHYLTIIEAIGPGGIRYYRAWTAPKLDGQWTPLADTWENPFMGPRNVVFAEGEPWSEDISHGEFLRTNPDQRMLLDPMDLRFLYQGRPKSSDGAEYLLLPYRLGLLTSWEGSRVGWSRKGKQAMAK